MKIPNLKSKKGFEMPALGFGTWRVGGAMTADSSNDKKHIESIRRALDRGVTLIDTAEVYSAGHSEEIIGEAISGYDRSGLFITSKVNWYHLGYEDVLISCRESLKRLKTSYLDLYLIHSPNPEVPVEETMKALDKLKEEGLIKEMGVSNFNLKYLKSAQSSTKNKIVTNQIHHNLAYRAWQDVVDYCLANDILITAYRPVERGILAAQGIEILDEVSKKYGKTQAQVAINWLISQGIVTLCKMESEEHLEEDLGSLNWKLEASDIEKLTLEFPEKGIMPDHTKD